MIDSLALGNKEALDSISEITTKILNRFRRKEKLAIIFFIVEKAYEKVNREKTFEQLENMRMQGRMMKFIRELDGLR